MWPLIEAIENTGFATWIRESPSLAAYTLVLALHAMGLAIVVGFSSVIALRLLGVASGIPLAPARKFFPLMYAGFWINALSGLALLAASATSMLANPLFFVKLGFVALGVLTMRLLRNRVFGDGQLQAIGPGGAVSATGRGLAVASLVCWGGAIVAGRLTAYPGLIEYYLGF
jgi:hypothetical protein